MHLVDWLIMTLPLLICGGIALYTRRYVRSVADFMAGGRNAGRFLICTARGEMGAGAVAYVSSFQIFLVAGFTISWWNQISVPAYLLIAISGFVIYRYRQTRAMTLAQFFEMRYSRKFRLFTGMLAFFAGLVNFGIIPVVGARFMVYFLELPQSVHLFSHDIPTHLVLMMTFLGISAAMTTMGGQVTILIADCAEGMFSQIFYVFIAITLIVVFFKWSDATAALLSASPGKSLVNPFETQGTKDFNIWYVAMGICMGMYHTMSWQNAHAFNASAATPHEARMGGILGRWRGFAGGVMITLLSVCALTYMNSPHGSVAVQASLNQIKDPATASQMRIPIALSQMLPIGAKGALLSIILMGIIAGDGMAMHSWSSIFVQDVIVPLRKKPLATAQHLAILRFAILGVAIWAFCFGALYPQVDYVQLWFSVTGAIFSGGAGAAIIGGLYWSRGTTAGAWAGVLTGSGLAVSGIIARQYCQKYMGHEFFLNGQQINFFSSLLAIGVYVVVSLLTCREPHDMDKLLHRGVHAIASDNAPVVPSVRRRSKFYRILGIDEQFSRSDRWITIGIFIWSMTWFAVFAVGSVGYLIHPWSSTAWAQYWLWTSVYLPLLIGIVTTIWFTWGCWHDMRLFFQRLRAERVDVHDDGSVTHDKGVEDVVERTPACRRR